MSSGSCLTPKRVWIFLLEHSFLSVGRCHGVGEHDSESFSVYAALQTSDVRVHKVLLRLLLVDCVRVDRNSSLSRRDPEWWHVSQEDLLRTLTMHRMRIGHVAYLVFECVGRACILTLPQVVNVFSAFRTIDQHLLIDRVRCRAWWHNWRSLTSVSVWISVRHIDNWSNFRIIILASKLKSITLVILVVVVHHVVVATYSTADFTVASLEVYGRLVGIQPRLLRGSCCLRHFSLLTL